MKASRIKQAAKLFEDFTGHEADEVIEIEVPDHDTHALVGEVEAIAYNTTRDDKRDSYIHEFKKFARPLLSASHDGRSLYILDGGYKFTDHGIEDKHMASIALVNPSPRKKGRKKMATRKHRTAAQKAATRRLVALNRSRQSGRKAVHKTARKRARKRTQVHTFRHPRAVRISNPHRRHRARKRNPMGGFMGKAFWMGEVLPTAIGGVSALGLDVAIGYLPLPAMVKTNMAVRNVVKIGGALLLGWGAQMMTNRRVGEEVAAGAIAVTLYDLVKGYLVNAFPNLPIVPAATIVIPTAATSQAGTAGIGWTGSAPQMGTYLSGDVPSRTGEREEDFIPGMSSSYTEMGSYVNAY